MVLMTSPGNLPNHYRRFAGNWRKVDGECGCGGRQGVCKGGGEHDPPAWRQVTAVANRRFARVTESTCSVYKVREISRGCHVTTSLLISSAPTPPPILPDKAERFAKDTETSSSAAPGPRHSERRSWQLTVRHDGNTSQRLAPDALPYLTFLFVGHEHPVRDLVGHSASPCRHRRTVSSTHRHRGCRVRSEVWAPSKHSYGSKIRQRNESRSHRRLPFRW